jgi:deazaflavin-dependent oxidoreductase (nitroreductase family)
VLGHRLLYIAHRGRRTGARREVVVETVRYDPAAPEAVVVAAWGGAPDWYRNLRTAPAVEVRLGGRRWVAPEHRHLDAAEVYRTLPGFPADPADPRWPEVAAGVHAIAFTPRR